MVSGWMVGQFTIAAGLSYLAYNNWLEADLATTAFAAIMVGVIAASFSKIGSIIGKSYGMSSIPEIDKALAALGDENAALGHVTGFYVLGGLTGYLFGSASSFFGVQALAF